VTDKMDDLVSGCAQNVPTKQTGQGENTPLLTCMFTAYSFVELPGIEPAMKIGLTSGNG
jgi:hypothetical protein